MYPAIASTGCSGFRYLAERAGHISPLFLVRNGLDGCDRQPVRGAMFFCFAGSRRCVRMYDMDESHFPHRRLHPEKIRPHLFRIGQRRLTEAEQRVNLGKKHGRPHTIELASHLRPVPSRGVRGVEHFLVLGGVALQQGEVPGSVVARGGKPAMPCSCFFRCLRVTQWPSSCRPEGFCTKKTQATANSEITAPQRKPLRMPPVSASTGASPPAASVVARADIRATNSATPAAPATC